MKRILRVLGKRGRTTLPYPFRKTLGFEKGDVISFTLEGEAVIVRKESLCECGVAKDAQAPDPSKRRTGLRIMPPMTGSQKNRQPAKSALAGENGWEDMLALVLEDRSPREIQSAIIRMNLLWAEKVRGSVE